MLAAVAGALKSVSVAAAVYTTAWAATFSFTIPVAPEVISGATSSRLFIFSVTNRSLTLPAASVATTVKL